MDQLYTAVVFPLILLVGQAIVALGQRKISQRMDDGQAKTDAKRKAEAEWRDSIDKRQDVSNLSNRRLKGILSMAARSAIHYNPDIKSYFERLVANGKPYGIAVNNVKNKLIHIMYALIKNASEYKPGYQHERKSA